MADENLVQEEQTDEKVEKLMTPLGKFHQNTDGTLGRLQKNVSTPKYLQKPPGRVLKTPKTLSQIPVSSSTDVIGDFPKNMELNNSATRIPTQNESAPNVNYKYEDLGQLLIKILTQSQRSFICTPKNDKNFNDLGSSSNGFKITVTVDPITNEMRPNQDCLLSVSKKLDFSPRKEDSKPITLVFSDSNEINDSTEGAKETSSFQ
jgi:hypothetical protein